MIIKINFKKILENTDFYNINVYGTKYAPSLVAVDIRNLFTY